MDSKSRRPAMADAIQNVRQPAPLRKKLVLFVRNNWIKVRTRSSCCGHDGEPGC